MKNILKFFTTAAMVIALNSCLGGDATYTKTDMGTMMNGYVQSDYGYKITFQPSEITFDKEKVTTGTRLYLTYQYTVSETTSAEVKATLMAYVIFPKNDIIRENEATAELGKDAIYVKGDDELSGGSIWASGGYINTEFKYYQAKNHTTVHDISMVYLESESKDGACVFELHHNAHGETIGYPGYDTSNTQLVSGYFSFDYMKVTGGNVKSIVVKFPWFKDEYLKSTETETKMVVVSVTEPKN